MLLDNEQESKKVHEWITKYTAEKLIQISILFNVLKKSERPEFSWRLKRTQGKEQGF